MKLTTEKIGDEWIEIEVDANGQFSATFNDEDFRAPTRLELVEKLKKAVRRAKSVKPIAVTVLGLVAKHKARDWEEPFEKGVGTVDAVLRGRHERNRVWLLTSEDKQKFQLGNWRDESVIVRRLSAGEKQQYAALVEAVRVSTTALEDFVGAVKIDPAQALEVARQDKSEAAR